MSFDTIFTGNRSYKDIDLSFGVHPLSKDVRSKNNVEAIKQAIRVIVMFNHYEKPYHPDIGSDVLKSLFENISFPDTQNVMRQSIVSTLELYEPRAEISDVVFDINADGNSVSVGIWFIPLNATNPIRVIVNLEKVR
jgi:phage baseplate assembly protein W